MAGQRNSIALFLYEKNTIKQQICLAQLAATRNHQIESLLFQGWKALNFPKPVYNIGLRDIVLPDIRGWMDAFPGVTVISCEDHNDLAPVLEMQNASMGVILGARIIKQHIIDCFPKGIINIHPGALPENRGLDNFKWALFKNIPMKITAHLIDSAIDRGRKICELTVPLFKTDTIDSFHARMMFAQANVMEQAIELVSLSTDVEKDFPPFVDHGVYHKTMPEDLERGLYEAFESYKKRFGLSV